MEFAAFLRLLNQTDGYGCGFLVIGCFSPVVNLILMFSVLVFGFKFLQSRCLEHHFDDNVEKQETKVEFCSKSDLREGGFCPTNETDNDFDQKAATCNDNSSEHFDDPTSDNADVLEDVENDVDQVFDVIILRNMVKADRERAKALFAELEKERKASASAAEEAMAALLRLQSEKSAVVMAFRQYQRIAEQKQEYDRELTERLQWIVTRQQEERVLLEERLRVCVQKLQLYATDDEILELDQTSRVLNQDLECEMFFE